MALAKGDAKRSPNIVFAFDLAQRFSSYSGARHILSEVSDSLPVESTLPKANVLRILANHFIHYRANI